jgi:hypothetical protein
MDTEYKLLVIDKAETLLVEDIEKISTSQKLFWERMFLLIIDRAETLPATYKSSVLRIAETAETLLIIENENAPGNDHSENSPGYDKVVISHNVNSPGNNQDVNSPAVNVIVLTLPVMNTVKTFLAQ